MNGNPYNQFRQQQQPPIIVPPPRRRRRRMRWEIILVPILLITVLWLIFSVNISEVWNDFLDAINIRDKASFSRIAMIGIACCIVCFIARTLRDSNSDDE